MTGPSLRILATFCLLPSTYSMVQSPSWEANGHPAGQEIFLLVLNPKLIIVFAYMFLVQIDLVHLRISPS
jgi:hypothetical protein